MKFILLSLLMPLSIAICLLSPVAGQDSPRKIALLVGVSDYQSKQVEDLQFAENDIRAVGGQLKLMGFEVTSLSGEAATRKKNDCCDRPIHGPSCGSWNQTTSYL